MLNVVQEIKEYMQENKISCEEMAKRIGWCRQNVWDKLNKRAEPNLDSVKRMAESIGGTFYISNIETSCDVTKNGDATQVFEAVENEQISYSVVEKILNSVGYSLKMNLPK